MNRWSSQRGTSALEFVLCIPFFMVIFVCLVNLAVTFQLRMGVEGASRLASDTYVRARALGRSQSDAQSRARQHVLGARYFREGVLSGDAPSVSDGPRRSAGSETGVWSAVGRILDTGDRLISGANDIMSLLTRQEPIPLGQAHERVGVRIDSGLPYVPNLMPHVKGERVIETAGQPWAFDEWKLMSRILRNDIPLVTGTIDIGFLGIPSMTFMLGMTGDNPRCY